MDDYLIRRPAVGNTHWLIEGKVIPGKSVYHHIYQSVSVI
jgi:hypothetical protein